MTSAWAGDGFAGVEFAIGFCPYLGIVELPTAAMVCKGWHRSVATIGAENLCEGDDDSPWQQLTASIEADSLALCGKGVDRPDHDHQEFEISLLLGSPSLEDVLPRMHYLLGSLPARMSLYLRLPGEHPGDLPWTQWRFGGVPAAVSKQLGPTSTELRRTWSKIFVLDDGGYDMHARDTAHSLAARWKRLWHYVRLVGLDATVASVHTQIHRGNEVRGWESWRLQVLALGTTSGYIASLNLSYYDSDKHYVR
mmetsp:Transcript_19431/g.35221  ORF Transcript_19431/g.35221 Transcript_19431/m.35221 type:complete len:252 (+) Transcript_19431:87-842(+)